MALLLRSMPLVVPVDILAAGLSPHLSYSTTSRTYLVPPKHTPTLSLRSPSLPQELTAHTSPHLPVLQVLLIPPISLTTTTHDRAICPHPAPPLASPRTLGTQLNIPVPLLKEGIWVGKGTAVDTPRMLQGPIRLTRLILPLDPVGNNRVLPLVLRGREDIRGMLKFTRDGDETRGLLNKYRDSLRLTQRTQNVMKMGLGRRW